MGLTRRKEKGATASCISTRMSKGSSSSSKVCGMNPAAHRLTVSAHFTLQLGTEEEVCAEESSVYKAGCRLWRACNKSTWAVQEVVG